jgi:exodeoxyribonuclease-3
MRVDPVFVPNGRDIGLPYLDYKLGWMAAPRDQLLVDQADGHPLLLVGGDFNVVPADTDAYDPTVFVGATPVSQPERAAIWATLAPGLEDLARRGAGQP